MKGGRGFGEDFVLNRNFGFSPAELPFGLHLKALLERVIFFGESSLDLRQSKSSLNFTTPDHTWLSVSNSCH